MWKLFPKKHLFKNHHFSSTLQKSSFIKGSLHVNLLSYVVLTMLLSHDHRNGKVPKHILYGYLSSTS